MGGWSVSDSSESSEDRGGIEVSVITESLGTIESSEGSGSMKEWGGESTWAFFVLSCREKGISRLIAWQVARSFDRLVDRLVDRY